MGERERGGEKKGGGKIDREGYRETEGEGERGREWEKERKKKSKRERKGDCSKNANGKFMMQKVFVLHFVLSRRRR